MLYTFGVELGGLRKAKKWICGSVMEFECDCTKHSSVYRISFMGWCTRISSITEGFREFL